MTCIGEALVTRGKSQQILKLCKEQNHLGADLFGQKSSVSFTVLVLQVSELVSKGTVCIFICIVVKTCEKTLLFFSAKGSQCSQI